MMMRLFPIRSVLRFPSSLSRLLLPALLLFVLYIFSLVVVDSFYAAENPIQIVSSQPPDQPKLLSHESLPRNQKSDGDEKVPQPKYNLMEETYGRKWAKKSDDNYFSPADCTEEYANKNQLQQDHPCVIRLIRQKYLRQPAPTTIPYQLGDPQTLDPSDGQAQGILRILRNQTKGFFIECGAYDGETLSNTLYMERSFQWSGLLIEADQISHAQLVNRNRRAYTSPVCLSTKPYPMEVVFNATVGTLGSILEDQKNSDQTSDKKKTESAKGTENIYKVQCFPLYSMLVAVGRTRVDYFSLDVEGSEYKILATIPWHKVDIKTLTVEWNHVPEGEAAMTRLMEKNKFVKFGLIEMKFSHEVVYVQDFLDDLRKFEDY
ncbi:protein Star-like [Daphnia pulex]|uniref:protein Star-like n=1 Tax=Daphnia pulex TaxID=6669 RepID=UPI001EE02FB5|nr:protein Star-like [Daphnia pulex]